MARATAKVLETTPKIQVKPTPTHNKQPRINKDPYIKKERNAVIALGIVLLVMSCLVIWSNTTVTKAQATIQNINQRVSALQTSNANMKEEISELSSRTRLMQVAKDVGLKMNDKNIRNVTK